MLNKIIKKEEKLKQKIMGLLNQNGFIKMSKETFEKKEVVNWEIMFQRIEIINKKKLKDKGIEKLSDFHKENIKKWFKIENNTNKKFIQNVSDAIIQMPKNNDPNSENISLNYIDYKKIDNNLFGYDEEVNLNTYESNDAHFNRADIVVYINGLPISIMELKHAEKDAFKNLDEKALVQLNRYTRENKEIFKYNCFVNLINESEALYATVKNDIDRIVWNYCQNWLYINGEDYERNKNLPKYEIMMKGMYNKKRLLQFIRFFIGYKEDGDKIIARYYQFYAVLKMFNSLKNKISTTIDSLNPEDKINQKCGYSNHSTGSGKSLSILFLANMISKFLTEFQILIITDRLSLNEQLYKSFDGFRLKNIANKKFIKPDNAKKLKEALKNKMGNIIFVNIQKFNTIFSDIDNSDTKYIVIIDEIHRTQRYEENVSDDGLSSQGWAEILRKKLLKIGYYTGFTGTPVYRTKSNNVEKDTKDLFGDELSSYKYNHAHSYDKSIVPIQFEARLLSLKRNPETTDKINEFQRQITQEFKNLGKQITTNNIIFNNKGFISVISNDIYNDWTKYSNNEKNGYSDFQGGKAIVIAPTIAGAREYLNKLRELFKDEINKKMIGLTISHNNNDKSEGMRNKSDEAKFVDDFKNPNSDLKIVIVVDKWRTGFDVPHLAKLYVTRPINDSANIFQTFSRVVRKYKEKKVGWVIDYTSEFNKRSWKEALRIYGGEKNTKLKTLDYISRIEDLEKEFNSKYNHLFNNLNLELQHKINLELKNKNKNKYSIESKIKVEFSQIKKNEWMKIIPFIKNMDKIFIELYKYPNTKIEEYKFTIFRLLFDEFRNFVSQHWNKNENKEHSREDYDKNKKLDNELSKYIAEVLEIGPNIYKTSWEEIIKNEKFGNPDDEKDVIKSELEHKYLQMAETENRTPDLINKISNVLKKYNLEDLKNKKILKIIDEEMINIYKKDSKIDYLEVFNDEYKKIGIEKLQQEFDDNKEVYSNIISGFMKYSDNKLSDKIYKKIFKYLAQKISECSSYEVFFNSWLKELEIRVDIKNDLNKILSKSEIKIPNPINDKNEFLNFIDICFVKINK